MLYDLFYALRIWMNQLKAALLQAILLEETGDLIMVYVVARC
jgi:hypothetical protein